MASYYIKTSGNDSNPGTNNSPFRSLQKFASIAVPGDIGNVDDGTYTTADGASLGGTHQSTAITCHISPAYQNGFVNQPITIRSINRFGARVVVPAITTTGNRGFRVARAHWIIEGFDITGNGATYQTSSGSFALTGIYVTTGATGSIARDNWIHNIGTGVCALTTFGLAGYFIEFGVADALVERNLIHTIGRLRGILSEGGCTLQESTLAHGDHGLYIKETTRFTARNNIIYDANRGYPIHIYGGVCTDLKIYHNTISGHAPTNTNGPGNTWPQAQVRIGGNFTGGTTTVTNGHIANNIFHDTFGAPINNQSLLATNVLIENNISTHSDADLLVQTHSGIISQNNLSNTNPNFVNPGANDFRLLSNSPAIGAGITIASVTNDFLDVARPQNSTYDIGAYESVGIDVTPPAVPTGLVVV